MKKTLSIFCFLICLIATSCYKNEIEDLNNRLESLEKLDSNRIATIQQQIAGINQTLADLDEADVELDKYLDKLKKTATNLETEILRIDEEISTIDANEKTVALGLEKLRNDMSTELARIEESIARLEELLTNNLNNKVDELKKYVSNGIQENKDWTAATFATLEQAEELATIIASVQSVIDNIRQDMEHGDKRLTADIEDLRKELVGVDDKISAAVYEVTSAYTEAIASAKDVIEQEYKYAISKAISNLEQSLQMWVNERLSNYYDIAEIDAKLKVIEEIHSENVSDLIDKVSKAKSELRAEYEKAIEEAIKNNDGLIDEKIANAIR
jgi:chromosome segregation ATPase